MSTSQIPLLAVWRNLTTAPGFVTDSEQRHRYKILFSAILLLIPINWILLLSFVLFDLRQVPFYLYPEFYLSVAETIALLGAFAWARKGAYRFAVIITVVSISISVIAQATPHSVLANLNLLNFLIVPLLLASTLLTLRIASLLAIIQIGAILVLIISWSERLDIGQIVADLLFLPVVMLAIIGLARYRRLMERLRTQQLEESEARYRTLFDSNATAVILHDGHTILLANNAAARIFGHANTDALIGQPFRNYIVDDSEIGTDLTATQPLKRFEMRIRSMDGALRWVEFYTSTIRLNNRHVMMMHAVDISERKEALDRLQRQNTYLTGLSETAIALMNRRGVDELLEIILTRSEGLMKTHSGFIYLLDDNFETMTVAIATGAFEPFLGHKASRGDGIAGEVWSRQEAIIIPDYEQWEKRVTKTNVGTIHSVIGIPLKANNTVIGVLSLGYIEPERQFTTADTETLQRFADLAAIALDSTQLYSDLQSTLLKSAAAENALQYRLDFERIISAVSTYFINLSPVEIDTGVEETLKMIGEFAEVDRSYIFLLEENDTRITNTHEWCAPGIASLRDVFFRRPVGLFQWSLGQLRNLQDVPVSLVAELPNTAEAERILRLDQDIQSFVQVPMVHRGRIVGLIGFDTIGRQRVWADDAISLLRIVGGIIAMALRRREAEAQIHFQANLLEVVEQSVIAVDMLGYVTYWNRATEQLYGWSSDRMIGRNIQTAARGRINREQLDVIFQHARSGTMWSGEFQFLQDERPLHVLMNTLPIRDEGDKLVGALIVSTDITELQRAQAELARRNRTLETLNNISRSIASALEYEELLETLLRLMAQALNATSTYIYNWEFESNTARVLADFTVPGSPEENMHQGQLPNSRQPSRETIQWLLDGSSHRERHEAGKMSTLQIPLLNQGHPIGFIEFWDSRTQRIFTEEEIEIAQSIGNQAATAIYRAQLYVALQRSEARNNAILDALPDMVLRQDREGRFLDVKAGIREDLIAPLNVLLGALPHEIMPASIANEFVYSIARTLDYGERPRIEYELERSSDIQFYEARFVALNQDEVISIVRNISDRKQAEQRQITLGVQQEKINILENFISDASHDLRQPLTNLKSRLYLLRKAQTPERQARQMQVLESEVLRLEALIEALITMSQLDVKTKFNFARVDLNHLIAQIVDVNLSVAEVRNLELIFIPDELVGIIEADAIELNRALGNLVANALNYTPHGSVTLRTFTRPDGVRIEVSDTGIGIKQSDLDHIFKRFFRADKARNTDQGGTGLGLAIVKKIIEVHHGEIDVTSEPDVGTTFSIWLPLRQPIEEPVH